MDCRNESTVDLCSDPECVNSTVKFKATDRKPHLPSHGMFKVYQTIFDRDLVRFKNTARDALDSALEVISELKDEGVMPECVHCSAAVSLPCWRCVECQGE